MFQSRQNTSQVFVFAFLRWLLVAEFFKLTPCLQMTSVLEKLQAQMCLFLLPTLDRHISILVRNFFSGSAADCIQVDKRSAKNNVDLLEQSFSLVLWKIKCFHCQIKWRVTASSYKHCQTPSLERCVTELWLHQKQKFLLLSLDQLLAFLCRPISDVVGQPKQ